MTSEIEPIHPDPREPKKPVEFHVGVIRQLTTQGEQPQLPDIREIKEISIDEDDHPRQPKETHEN